MKKQNALNFALPSHPARPHLASPRLTVQNRNFNGKILKLKREMENEEEKNLQRMHYRYLLFS